MNIYCTPLWPMSFMFSNLSPFVIYTVLSLSILARVSHIIYVGGFFFPYTILYLIPLWRVLS
ncbi:hypothetical protein JB92DRAFT_3062702, partial [Gautieria morchelliformis]